MFDKINGDKTSHWSFYDKSTHINNSTIVDKTHETLMKFSAQSSVFFIVIISMLSLLAVFAMMSFCCGPEIPTMVFGRIFKSIGSGIAFFAKALLSIPSSVFNGLFGSRPNQSSEHSRTHQEQHESVSPRSIATFGTVPESQHEPVSPRSIATLGTGPGSHHSDISMPESVRSSALLSVRESLQRRQTQ